MSADWRINWQQPQPRLGPAKRLIAPFPGHVLDEIARACNEVMFEFGDWLPPRCDGSRVVVVFAFADVDVDVVRAGFNGA